MRFYYMKINERDAQILQHIVQHCEEIDITIKRFGRQKSYFEKDPVYVNAISMPILQIGELAKRLSEDFIKKSLDIPWKAIKGMRDMFAHQYHSMNKEKIWETAIEDIPILNKKCQQILKENKLEIPKIRIVGLNRGR